MNYTASRAHALVALTVHSQVRSPRPAATRREKEGPFRETFKQESAFIPPPLPPWLRLCCLLHVCFVAEVQQLLGDVVMAAMRELEELREQGETELASIIGDDHARTARLRQDQVLRLTLVPCPPPCRSTTQRTPYFFSLRVLSLSWGAPCVAPAKEKSRGTASC